MKILTVFKLELKDLFIYFSSQWLTETIVDQKSLFGIFSPIFIVVLCDNFSKNFKFENFFIILAIFLQNKCKIRDLLPIFFFAFFASFSLQRIFFAKIFFVCKDSLFAPNYSFNHRSSPKKQPHHEGQSGGWLTYFFGKKQRTSVSLSFPIRIFLLYLLPQHHF